MTPTLSIDDTDSLAVVAEVGLAAHPEWVAAIWCTWAGLGAIVAAAQARRGHDVRPLLALGLVLGPFLHLYGRTSLPFIESGSEPEVVRHGGGDRTGRPVLVVLDDDPNAVVDALPALRLVATDAPVEIVRLVNHDVVRSPDGDEHSIVVRTAEAAALFLHEFDPALVLVPGGGPEALHEYSRARGAAAIVVVGPDVGQRGPGVEPSGRAAIIVDGRATPLEHLR